MTLSTFLRRRLLPAVTAALLAFPGVARSLMADEVLVVANRNARDSLELAKYYVNRRSIPAANLLTLWVTDNESCSPEEYEERIAVPIRRHLLGPSGKALRAVVLMHGVPLRVSPPEPSAEERWKLTRLELEQRDLSGQEKDPAADGEQKTRIAKRTAEIRSEIEALRRSDQEASVDSELALVRMPRHEKKGWFPNPLFLGARETAHAVKKDEVLLVSRLDGPSEALIRRVIDDTLSAESTGLQGAAYFDARWKDPGNAKPLAGYALWDQSLHEAAAALKKKGFSVVLDDAEALFPEGSRLPAALYCGWYSLSRYVGAFAWRKGAVAYHIASGECVTLRSGPSQAWCKRMLEEGVAATVGPVGEPYVQAFPPPHLFFQLLVDGRLTLGEAYYLSLPFLSWKMVLVGDPLYRPFAAR